jgi:type I restriction enzyme S subunit
MIDLTPAHLESVKRILAEYVPDCEVRAFGSRCKGAARKFSDLDLAVCGHEKLPWLQLADLQEAFQESDLPFRVDVLDYHTVSDNFRAIIDKDYEIVV